MHMLLTHMYLWINHLCISLKHILVHLCCHLITKTKQGPLIVALGLGTTCLVPWAGPSTREDGVQLFGLLACYGEQLVARALLRRYWPTTGRGSMWPAALATLILGWAVAKGVGAIMGQVQVVAGTLGRVACVRVRSRSGICGRVVKCA
jgi:hypothetical protein